VLFIIIPGILISIATFPGVIVHEAAHMLFCRWNRLAVFEVVFFQFKDPAGYVIHEEPKGFNASFFVSMGPFLVNTALCILFCTAAFLPVWELGVRDPVPYFFYWLGLSIGMHAFPSTVDLDHVFQRAPEAARKGNVLAILSYPLVAILYVLNLGRFFWADLLYGIAVGILVPLALFRALV
jgi:hypothetical protein